MDELSLVTQFLYYLQICGCLTVFMFSFVEVFIILKKQNMVHPIIQCINFIVLALSDLMFYLVYTTVLCCKFSFY